MIEKFKTHFFVKSSLISLYLALTIPLPFISIEKLKIPSIIIFVLGLYFIINITSDYVETCSNKISYKSSFISKLLGKKNLSNTKSILASIDLAVKLAKNGEVAAIVTNPINKDVIGKKVKNFRGHTEYLAKKDKTNEQLMVMMNRNLKTIPLTTHIAVNKVSSKINKKNIIKAIINANLSLRNDFKIKKPRIAVTALNPHAGDGGLIGDDEKVKILMKRKKGQKLLKEILLCQIQVLTNF